jgi:hypothetical protein
VPKLIMTICVALLLNSAGQAQERPNGRQSTREFLERVDIFPEYRAYLAGLESGIAWYHTESIHGRYKNHALYCPPGNLALTNDQLVSILRDWARREPDRSNYLPIGYAFLRSLIDTFPCPAAQR